MCSSIGLPRVQKKIEKKTATNGRETSQGNNRIGFRNVEWVKRPTGPDKKSDLVLSVSTLDEYLVGVEVKQEERWQKHMRLWGQKRGFRSAATLPNATIVQLVEHTLGTGEVKGSIPFSCSTFRLPDIFSATLKTH